MSAALKHRPTDAVALRRRMERAIERLIAALDALDGDPDLEPECEDEGAECNDEGVSELEPDLAGAATTVWGTDSEGDGPAFDGPDPWRQ